MPLGTIKTSGLNSDTTRMLSPSVWGDCEIEKIKNGGLDGLFFFDDFISSYDLAAGSSATNLGPYVGIADTAASMAGYTASAGAGVLADMGGHQQLISGTTADADCTLQLGGGAPFIISDTSADTKKLWMEFRFKISSITDDGVAFFIGLAEADSVADGVPLTASGGTAVDSAFATNTSFIGFWRPDGDGSGLSFVYGEGGQTKQEHISDFATLVADTYIKIGFTFDPSKAAGLRGSVFANGVEHATHLTGTQIAAATFPDATPMAPIVAIKSDGSTSNTLTLDWWSFSQLL